MVSKTLELVRILCFYHIALFLVEGLETEKHCYLYLAVFFFPWLIIYKTDVDQNFVAAE